MQTIDPPAVDLLGADVEAPLPQPGERRPGRVAEPAGGSGELVERGALLPGDRLQQQPHLAARRGVPTVMLLPPVADWLLGDQPGKSPWYPSLELMREDDQAALAARLAASG